MLVGNLVDLAVAKLELTLELALASATACPMIGFDIGYQLSVVLTAIAVAAELFKLYKAANSLRCRLFTKTPS